VAAVPAAAAAVSCACSPVRPVLPPPAIAEMVSSQIAVWYLATAPSADDPSAAAWAWTSLT
jgi:hypothetical protein